MSDFQQDPNPQARVENPIPPVDPAHIMVGDRAELQLEVRSGAAPANDAALESKDVEIIATATAVTAEHNTQAQPTVAETAKDSRAQQSQSKDELSPAESASRDLLLEEIAALTLDQRYDAPEFAIMLAQLHEADKESVREMIEKAEVRPIEGVLADIKEKNPEAAELLSQVFELPRVEALQHVLLNQSINLDANAPVVNGLLEVLGQRERSLLHSQIRSLMAAQDMSQEQISIAAASLDKLASIVEERHEQSQASGIKAAMMRRPIDVEDIISILESLSPGEATELIKEYADMYGSDIFLDMQRALDGLDKIQALALLNGDTHTAELAGLARAIRENQDPLEVLESAICDLSPAERMQKLQKLEQLLGSTLAEATANLDPQSRRVLEELINKGKIDPDSRTVLILERARDIDDHDLVRIAQAPNSERPRDAVPADKGSQFEMKRALDEALLRQRISLHEKVEVLLALDNAAAVGLPHIIMEASRKERGMLHNLLQRYVPSYRRFSADLERLRLISKRMEIGHNSVQAEPSSTASYMASALRRKVRRLSRKQHRTKRKAANFAAVLVTASILLALFITALPATAKMLCSLMVIAAVMIARRIHRQSKLRKAQACKEELKQKLPASIPAAGTGQAEKLGVRLKPQPPRHSNKLRFSSSGGYYIPGRDLIKRRLALSF